MDKMKRVSVEDRDNFVAYLDGELSPDEIKKLEGILADSPVARKDVEMLVRTYELLDLLPRPQATTEFTQRTMATVKLADVKPDLTQSWWYKRAHLHRGSDIDVVHPFKLVQQKSHALAIVQRIHGSLHLFHEFGFGHDA